MEVTLKFAKKLNPDWCTFEIFIACPDSELYQEIMQNGLYDRTEGYLAYVKTDEFNYESLIEIQKRFQSSFNLSPKRMLRIVKQDGVLTALKKGFRLLSS
jgi:hypothetical protein